MLLSVVIPCLNERKTIRTAVAHARLALQRAHVGSFEIIVADNGSTDGSLDVLGKLRSVRVVCVPIRGYGAALHWGILHAKGRYVFFADADLSYDFSELRLFLPYTKKKFDLVLGSRFRGTIKRGAMPWLHRYLGTPVLTRLIRWLYGIPVTDSNSGMRMVRSAFYRQMNLRNAGMEWASELLIKTAIYNGKYAEVPITLHKDQRNRSPHLAAWADGWRHLKAILLLKPNILFLPVPFLIVVAVLSWQSYFHLAVVMLFVATGLGLAIVAAKLLQFAIDDRPSRIVALTLRLPLVLIWLGACLLVLLITPFLNQKSTSWLLFVWGQLVVYSIWVFFIETIKTHSINRLPDTLQSKRLLKQSALSSWSFDPSNAPTLGQRVMSSLSWIVRRSQFNVFERTMRPLPSDKVLDVGTRPEENLSDSNFFEKVYPYPQQLTAASVEDCTALFSRTYPDVKFRQVRAGKKLPFRTHQFDIVVSWATLEHVGSRAQQRFFLRELLRVGKRAFITTPDGWAIYDPHTSWLLLHWLPTRYFRYLCKIMGKAFWSSEQNLNILTESALIDLLPKRKQVAILKTKLLSILPAHLIVVQKGRYEA